MVFSRAISGSMRLEIVSELARPLRSARLESGQLDAESLHHLPPHQAPGLAHRIQRVGLILRIPGALAPNREDGVLTRRKSAPRSPQGYPDRWAGLRRERAQRT